MKKVLIIVLMAVMAIGYANCQVDDAKKEYLLLLDSAYELATQNSDAALQITEELATKYGWNSDIYFIRGMAYVNAGLYPLAVPYLENGCKEWKKDDFFRVGAFYKVLSAIYLEMEMDDKALQAVSNGIKRDKSYYILYYIRGDIYSDQSNHKKAIADYKKACADEDYFCDAKAKMAVCYAQMDNMKEARKAIDESLKQNKYHGESRRLKALFALSDENIEGFIDEYMLYMQIDMPTSPDYIYEIIEDKQYYDYGMNYAKSILESKSDSIDIAYWEYIISQMESTVGKDDEMWVHAQRARAMNPGNKMLDHQIEYIYASHYNINEDYVNVVTSLDSLISYVGEENSETLYLLTAKGKTLSQMKRMEDAAAVFEKAVAVGTKIGANPFRMMTLYFRLAELYHKELNEPDKAIAYYDSMLVITPTSSPILYQKGKVYQRMKHDTVKANEVFAQIVEIESKSDSLDNDSYAQFALAQMGRYDEAEAYQKRLDEYAASANADNKQGMAYNAACLYSIIGKPDMAIEKLMEAMDAGELDCEAMKNDEDFNNIRENNGYKAIEKVICSAEEDIKK